MREMVVRGAARGLNCTLYWDFHVYVFCFSTGWLWSGESQTEVFEVLGNL